MKKVDLQKVYFEKYQKKTNGINIAPANLTTSTTAFRDFVSIGGTKLKEPVFSHFF
jgi:hypothetical protein